MDGYANRGFIVTSRQWECRVPGLLFSRENKNFRIPTVAAAVAGLNSVYHSPFLFIPLRPQKPLTFIPDIIPTSSRLFCTSKLQTFYFMIRLLIGCPRGLP